MSVCTLCSISLTLRAMGESSRALLSSSHSKRLRPLDIRTLVALHQKINIIPVIAKSDTLTKTELRQLKAQVTAESKISHVFD